MNGRETLGTARATLDKRQRDVAAMFDRVAARYDIANDILSLGQDRAWRRLVQEAVAPQSGETILDVAAGTGTSTALFVEAGAFVVATDLSLGMLTVGRQRQPQLTFVAGDALRLPFRDSSFDAVTITFGLRNVEDTSAALDGDGPGAKPGGRLVICEFSTPPGRPSSGSTGAISRRRCPRSPLWSRPTPPRIAISQSPFRRGPISRGWPSWSPRPVGARWPGATCPGGSSRSTAPDCDLQPTSQTPDGEVQGTAPVAVDPSLDHLDTVRRGGEQLAEVSQAADQRVIGADRGAQTGEVNLVRGGEDPLERRRQGGLALLERGEDAATAVVGHHDPQVGSVPVGANHQSCDVVQERQVTHQREWDVRRPARYPSRWRACRRCRTSLGWQNDWRA